ncbi:hemogen isoform X1 [Bufo bufo]|uniref:hemogen isoform X1 n=2 Tax=Bufo bufo TaxID=8384 RepID=UPI001ABD9CD9|nr:hemogen isoform X1 [Bufo bufo]
MGDFERDHHYSELSGTSAPENGHHEQKQQSPVPITRRLRDREMLKRKKEEAQEKHTYQWVFGEQSSSKRQRKTKGTGHGRRKQVKEPEPEPEPEHESDEVQHAPQQEEQHHETEGEKKIELLSDVPQEHFEPEQETLLHHEDLPTATEGETADVTLLIHEDADGHLPQEASPLLEDKEEVAESDPVPVTEAPEVLAFPFEQEQVEHQYYTPLL